VASDTRRGVQTVIERQLTGLAVAAHQQPALASLAARGRVAVVQAEERPVVHDPVAQVDVGDLEAGQLRQPQAAVQEQHDDGVVPSGREVPPGAGGEQPAQLLIR
jgi:hypothetical protein